MGDWAKKGMLSEKSFVQSFTRVQATERVQKPETPKATISYQASGPMKGKLVLSQPSTGPRKARVSPSPSNESLTPLPEDELQKLRELSILISSDHDDDEAGGGGSDVDMD